MNDIAAFLGTCPVFTGMTTEEINQLAGLFRPATCPAGSVILEQGGYSNAVYFLRTGRLAVRVRRGIDRETVAILHPGEPFGELSFLTGRQCLVAIEAVSDSEVVYLPKEVMPAVGFNPVVHNLLNVLATRLQITIQANSSGVEIPIVLIRNYPHWAAPEAFPVELASSLARQSASRILVMNLGKGQARDLIETSPQTAVLDLGNNFDAAASVRPVVEQALQKQQGFDTILINVSGPSALAIADQLEDLCNFRGYLLGPGDPVPDITENETVPDFIVQASGNPTLPFLSGGRQLIRETGESEDAFKRNHPVTPGFRRTVDSIARRIAGLQVGLALGGGAAWGWAHIGVLQAIEKAGLPIDMVTGCSMGSVVGSLYSSGYSTDKLTGIAEYWNTRTKRFIEWRLWRMCLVNERAVRKVFTQYFGNRCVNQTDFPFWANAVDIERGEEYTIREGTLVDCIRSSIALPGLLPPHSQPPRLLVDAGIMDPVPAVLLRKMGCDYAVAVNAMASPGSTRLSTRYPFNAFQVMAKCMSVMGHEIGQRAEQSANIEFTPELSGIHMLQFQRSGEIIQRGRQATEERLPSILAGYQRFKNSLQK